VVVVGIVNYMLFSVFVAQESPPVMAMHYHVHQVISGKSAVPLKPQRQRMAEMEFF
jgi:hypothetical protein